MQGFRDKFHLRLWISGRFFRLSAIRKRRVLERGRYIRLLTERHNRRAGCVQCLFRRTVNVAWGLAFPFPRRRWPVRPGSPTRGHVARMASVTFFIFASYLLLLPSPVSLLLDNCTGTCANILLKDRTWWIAEASNFLQVQYKYI